MSIEYTRKVEEEIRLYNTYKDMLKEYADKKDVRKLHAIAFSITNNDELSERNKHLLMANYHVVMVELV